MADEPVDEKAAFLRLPKWAQHRISKLETDVAYLQKRQAKTLNGTVFSDERMDLVGPAIIVEPYSDAPVSIDPETLVCFRIGDFRSELRIKFDRDGVDISGAEPIDLEPNSSNGVRIKMRPSQRRSA